LERMSMSVAFAEEGEFDTARQMMDDDEKEKEKDKDE